MSQPTQHIPPPNAIPDDIVIKMLNKEIPINIEDTKYYLSVENPVRGDKVLDIHDGAHGVHDGAFGKRIAVKDGWVTEGVKPNFVYKLKPITDESDSN